MTVSAIVIDRSSHAVVAAGEDIAHPQFEVETDLYGNPDFDVPTDNDLIFRMGPPYSINFSAAMQRVQPFKDDQFPTSMPSAITNAGFRSEYGDVGTPSTADEVERIDLFHLSVQDEARRMGYGQLMWDVYLATAAYGNYTLSGGVGSSEGGATYKFLRQQGVPESDISPGRDTPGEGSGLVRWETPVENAIRTAPLSRQEVSMGE